MFIRETETKNKKTMSVYKTHKLVENYRTEKGVRQRVIMSLGSLSLPKSHWRELAALLESRISGQNTFLEEDKELTIIADEVLRHNTFIKRLSKEKIDTAKNSDMQLVDLNSASNTFSRSLGSELIAHSFWEKLNFDGILKECKFDNKQISLAKALILGRLIYPQSELSTWRWFQNSTALIEMTPVDLAGVSKNSFYEIGDLLFQNKEKIEKALFTKEEREFQLENRVYLYDLTNTYFEGSANGNKYAKFGHSKEKRTDCPQVTLALVVDGLGFPVFSQIYEGGQSEPKTLRDVLNRLKLDSDNLLNDDKPVLIMDRGIATKDNVALIAENNYPYTIITRRQSEKDYEDDFTIIKQFIESNENSIPAGWESVDTENSVYVKKILLGKTACVLSASTGRNAKEQGMDALKEERFLIDIEKLKKSFEKGNILLPVKIGERIGKIKAKYPTVGKYYEIEVKISDDNKKVTEIIWTKKLQRQTRSILAGCYVIETTQIDLSAKGIWKQYMQLTRVESAFQDLKSELGLRPVYHQKAHRTESHLFIGVLAYHILNSIEYVLKTNGDTREWKTIKEILATHQRSTIILRGDDNKIYHIRVSGTPEPCHNEIYRTLKIKDHLKRKKTCTFSRL
jgi:transposase